MARHTVERLTSTDATARRYSHLCRRVRKGRSSRSASSSLLARSSSLGLELGSFLGASERPSSAVLTERFTEESETEKVRVAWLLPIPRLSASMIFFLRSSEYAFRPPYPYGSVTL